MNRNRKPALSIDNSMSAALTAEVKDGKYNLDDGVPLGLSKGDKSKIIYRKYEAVSDNITDTRHREWHEVLVAHEKISLLGMEDRLLDDDIVGISADDGMILKFEGQPEQVVCIDHRSMRVINEDQAELEEEAMGIEYVRYTEWGFRLVEVLLTNGPEARQRLAETYERQKNMEQAEMFTSMEEFFSSMMGRLEQMGQVTNNPQQLAQSANSVLDPHKVMQEMLKTQSPEQLKAMIEMQGAEEDIVPEASAEELADDAAIENALEGVGSDLLESATTGKKSGRSKK
tara:strand:+ start:6017 stop:6874 length:858 start_codon:yes stop_codon:yes gene_type:complete